MRSVPFLVFFLPFQAWVIPAELAPTSSLAFAYHRCRTIVQIVNLFYLLFASLIITFLLVLVAHRRLTRPRAFARFALTSLILVLSPFLNIAIARGLVIYRWGSQLNNTYVLAVGTSDFGSTIWFPQGHKFHLFERSQGIYDLMDENNYGIICFDFRNEPKYTVSSNTSISSQINENPMEFPSIGLTSAGEWVQRCDGMGVILTDTLGVVIESGIILRGETLKIKVKVRMRLNVDELLVVLGEMSIFAKRLLLEGCH